MGNKFRLAVKERWIFILFISLMAGLFFSITVSIAMEDKKEEKRDAHSNAYQLYQSKCLSCHISIADPEKPGRTRDDWFLVINIMHEYGLGLDSKEKETITDFLFAIRKKPAPHY